MLCVTSNLSASILLGMILLGPTTGVWAKSDARQETIANAANAAQEGCYRQMYRDSNAYAQCLRDMRSAQLKSPLKKLGIEYFGFVGALSYMRVGHINSEQIAAEFLQAYRQTQKKVGISDSALCSTIPGDCTVRMAQTREMEAAPPKQVSMRMQCVGKVCGMVPVP
jgi:hypothetical protein